MHWRTIIFFWSGLHLNEALAITFFWNWLKTYVLASLLAAKIFWVSGEMQTELTGAVAPSSSTEDSTCSYLPFILKTLTLQSSPPVAMNPALIKHWFRLGS